MQQEKYRDLDQGKDQSPLITIHMRNTPQQSETRWVTQKTPFKKPLYIRYSFSRGSRASKKGEIAAVFEGLDDQIHFLTMT